METRDVHDGDNYCQCVSQHSPVVQHVHRHHIVPLADGGGNEPENLIWLCPNAHEHTHILLRAWKQYEGEPPWEVRRRFSPFIRALAERGVT